MLLHMSENKLLTALKNLFTGRSSSPAIRPIDQPTGKIIDEIIMGHIDFDDIFKRGREFDYIHESRVSHHKKFIRLHLVWISPEKNLYLFNTGNGKKFRSFSKAEMVHGFHEGKLIPMGLEQSIVHNNDKIIH